jgi:GNAT superfamily N-acetyltransferase
MATQFRQLGPADAETLSERLLSWHRGEGNRLDAALVRHETRRLLSDNERWHAWMIVSRGDEVGYLMLQFRRGGMFEAPRAYVAALYLGPAARARGTGMLAHRFLADLCRWLQVRLYDFDTADEAKPLQWTVHNAPRPAPPGHSFFQATA